jgi:hypothetical protein
LTEPERISAVLPVKLSGRHYGHNLGYCDLMFASFRHFGLDQLFEEILIVVPAAEQSAVTTTATRWSDFPVQVVAEEDAFPILRSYARPHQVRPWHRQQYIKLASGALVRTRYMMTLDPDVFAIKPVRFDDVVVDGRALLEPELREVHRQWWVDSAELLGVDPGLERTGMNVTPALFVTDVLAVLRDRLEQHNGRPWSDVLLGSLATWTEPMLYFLTAEQLCDLSRFHVWPEETGRGTRLHSSVSVWTPEQYASTDFARFFADDNPGLFAVVQSAIKADPRDIARRLEPWIPYAIGPYRPWSSPVTRGRELYGSIVREALRAGRALRRKGGGTAGPA